MPALLPALPRSLTPGRGHGLQRGSCSWLQPIHNPWPWVMRGGPTAPSLHGVGATAASLRCPGAATRTLPAGRRQSALSVLVSPVTKAIAVALLCSVTSLGVSLEEETVLSGIDF